MLDLYSLSAQQIDFWQDSENTETLHKPLNFLGLWALSTRLRGIEDSGVSHSDANMDDKKTANFGVKLQVGVENVGDVPDVLPLPQEQPTPLS